MKNKAIEIKDLVIDYGNSIAVNKINLEVDKGELVTLLGPSGCGKSTTLNALAGLITSTSGKIYFDGINVTKFSPKERDIGLVFQSYALYPHMTVYKNVAFPLLANDKFKKQIEEQNKEFDNQILKIKYELAGGENFTKLWKLYEKFKNDLTQLTEELEMVNFKAKNAIKNAKELKSQVKVRKEGRIKAAAEETLNFITENENRIEELKKEAGWIRNSDLQEDKKEKELDKLRKALSDIENLNSKKYDAYGEKVKQIKEDFKNEVAHSVEEKKRIISEVNEWQKVEKEKINEAINKLKSEKQEEAEGALNKIKAVASTLNESDISEKDAAKIKDIDSKKNSWKVELDKKVREVAERVGISDQLEKKVTQLSGGQQQRVAISRTLVKSPKVLLLDEPLSNLDAKMRVQTREWIRNLQQELGITTVFVTHDQEEAMSISDKIVCMSKGHIQQVDEPMDMYHNPANKFVAGFLGMPQMNFIEATTDIGKKLVTLSKNKEAVTFGIRPEHVKNVNEAPKPSLHTLTLDGEVVLTESFGREKLVTAKFGKEIIKFFSDDITLDRGHKVKIGFKKEKIYMFNDEGHGDTIGRV